MNVCGLIILNNLDTFFSKNSELLNSNNFCQGRVKYVLEDNYIVMLATVFHSVLGCSQPSFFDSGPKVIVRPSACLSSHLPSLNSRQEICICAGGAPGVPLVSHLLCTRAQDIQTEFTWKTYKAKFSSGKEAHEPISYFSMKRHPGARIPCWVCQWLHSPFERLH